MNQLLQNMHIIQSAGILFILALITHIVLGFVLKKIIIHADKTQNQWDDVLINAISMPLKVLIWFVWIYLSIDSLKTQLIGLDILIDMVNIIPIFIITWGIVRIVSGAETHILNQKTDVNNDSIRLIMRLVRMLIMIAIGLGVAQYFGFSISSLLTFGGVGGVVMGFAAKDMLANIFGGLMIQMDKPFSTGEWIRSSQFEGVVEKIGWRMTRIRTFNKNPVYIPNSIFASIPIETPSRMSNRRIHETIGIRYNDIKQLPNILQEIENMLEKNQDIDHKQDIRVYFNQFNASSLDFHISTFTNTISKGEYQKIKQQILLNIATIIDQHGAEIAYPTQTLYLQK